jgi:hypothetical protein
MSTDRLGLFDPFTSFGDAAGQSYSAIQQMNRKVNEMVDAATIGSDKYFHCKAHCEACREGPGGEFASYAGGLYREIRNLGADAYAGNQMSGGGAFSDAREDMRANAAGRAAWEQDLHCATACRPWAYWLPPRYDSEAHMTRNLPLMSIDIPRLP